MAKHFLVNDSLFYTKNKYVEKNPFINMTPEDEPLPLFEDSKDKLPKPIWEGHDDVMDCYYKTWEIAFRNLRKPNAEAGFVSNFIDTAFNGYLFLWDSSFIVMFGRYGSHIFNFQKTLDNLYSHQHIDGFICREICEEIPGEQFQRDDPSSTGPNIMPWSEWEYYCLTGDKERLSKIFYPLLAYHKWLQLNRTWRPLARERRRTVGENEVHFVHHSPLLGVSPCGGKRSLVYVTAVCEIYPSSL